MEHHEHEHEHEHSELGEMDLRVRALESVLTEKGYVDPAALDALIEHHETIVNSPVKAAMVGGLTQTNGPPRIPGRFIPVQTAQPTRPTAPRGSSRRGTRACAFASLLGSDSFAVRFRPRLLCFMAHIVAACFQSNKLIRD